MSSRLHSQFTFVYKWILPLIWIPGFGLGVIFVAFGWGEVDGAPGLAFHKVALPVVWAITSTFILWSARRLRTVYLHADHLRIGNGREEEDVPLGSVIQVTENWFFDPKLITIRYARPNGEEERAHYIARYVVHWPFSPHPDVRYLREEVEAARQGAPPRQRYRKT